MSHQIRLSARGPHLPLMNPLPDWEFRSVVHDLVTLRPSLNFVKSKPHRHTHMLLWSLAGWAKHSEVKGRMMVVRRVRLTALIAAIALMMSPAMGRDLDGRYKGSPLHDWFEHLASRKGLCCSFADGYVVEDADWQTTADGKHYRVRIPLSVGNSQTDWVDVPDEAVITEPNRMGRTMVWPLYGNGGVSIRCFMPGSMT